MKVGTDGVLLGAWVPTSEPSTVLDVGAGTGLIALMLHQRFPKAEIVALEPHAGAAADARENILRAEAGHKISLKETTLQEYLAVDNSRFDLIVSNPPFFRKSMAARDAGRQLARHDDSLTCAALLDAAAQLTEQGMLAAIYPIDMRAQITSLIAARGLRLEAEQIVHPVPHKMPHRVLFAVTKSPLHSTFSPAENFSIETGVRHEYTPEFKRLVAPFYLNIEDPA